MTHKIERRADGLAVLSLKRGKEESQEIAFAMYQTECVGLGRW